MTDRRIVDEWAGMAATWSSGPEQSPIDLVAIRKEIAATRRRTVVSLTIDVILTIVCLVGIALALRGTPSAFAYFTVADVTAILVATWGFGIWNQRGLWKPSAETTRAFVVQARLRCVRRMRAAEFIYILVVMQLVFVYSWRATATSPAEHFRTAATVSAWLVVAAFVGWATWTRLRAKRELMRLSTIHRELLD